MHVDGLLGVYGTSSGTWSMQNAGLKLVPCESDGMFKQQPLDRLRVVLWQGHYLLLQESDVERLTRYGPDTHSFHQEPARMALQLDWQRRIEFAVKQFEIDRPK